MRQGVGWAIAFFGGMALLFVGLLIVGLRDGELRLPSRDFGVRVQRATNPIGFHVTAVFYAALAGLSSYPLWLLLQDRRKSATFRTATGSPHDGAGATLNLTGKVTVLSEGRGGKVRVHVAGGTHDFWWELGGGDCVAILTVPSADEWPKMSALAVYSRDAFLNALASEVGRLQCPHADYEIEPRAIVFRDVRAHAS